MQKPLTWPKEHLSVAQCELITLPTQPSSSLPAAPGGMLQERAGTWAARALLCALGWGFIIVYFFVYFKGGL